MTVKRTTHRTPPKLAARDFPELNRKLAVAREFCSRICGENGIRTQEVKYSFSTRIARQGNDCVYLNPFSMRLLDDREIRAVVGHEIGHAEQPKYCLFVRLFVQRRLEYKADAFSAKATGDPDALASVFRKKDEISFRAAGEGKTLGLMHRLVGKITHPSEKKRIARLMMLKEEMKPEGTPGGSD